LYPPPQTKKKNVSKNDDDDDDNNVNGLVTREKIQSMASLQKACRALLQKDLNKSEQCSAWHVRPLRREQVLYACLDAAVVLCLFEMILPQLRESQKIHRSITWNFTLLSAPPEEQRWSVTRGAVIVRRVLGQEVILARQTWHDEGEEQLQLPPPVLIPKRAKQEEEQDSVPETATSTTPETPVALATPSQSKKNTSTTPSTSPPLLILSSIPLPVPLPAVGTSFHSSKHSCIRRLLVLETPELPPNIELYYNRRSGVVSVANAHLLFVNFWHTGGNDVMKKYRNEFLDNGKEMTFTVDPRKVDERALLDNFTLEEESSRKQVLLFLRPAHRSNFMYCGRCDMRLSTAVKGQKVLLILVLTQYQELMAGESASVFREVVASRSAPSSSLSPLNTTTAMHLTPVGTDDNVPLPKTKTRLDALTIPIANLPPASSFLGKNRQSVVQTCLGKEFMERYGTDTILQFPSRGRVMSTANTTLVFLDCDNGKYMSKHRVDFDKNNVLILMDAGKQDETLLFQKLTKIVSTTVSTHAAVTGRDTSDDHTTGITTTVSKQNNNNKQDNDEDDNYQMVLARKTCLLFIRPPKTLSLTKGRYIYCGICRVIEKEPQQFSSSSKMSKLTLELLEYDSLTKSNLSSDTAVTTEIMANGGDQTMPMTLFQRMVKEHTKVQQRVDMTFITGVVEVMSDTANQNQQQQNMAPKSNINMPLIISLSVNWSNLPPLGTLLGHTPLTCVSRLMGLHSISSLKAQAAIRQCLHDDERMRNHVVEMSNATLLFLSLKRQLFAGKYKSVMMEGGQRVTFIFRKENRTLSHDGNDVTTAATVAYPVWYYLQKQINGSSGGCGKDTGLDTTKKMIIFVRPPCATQFLFCGESVLSNNHGSVGDCDNNIMSSSPVMVGATKAGQSVGISVEMKDFD